MHQEDMLYVAEGQASSILTELSFVKEILFPSLNYIYTLVKGLQKKAYLTIPFLRPYAGQE